MVLVDDRLRAIWNEQRVNDPRDSIDVVPTKLGTFTFHTTSFVHGTTPGLNLVIGVPVDDVDRRLVERLLTADTS